jgi:ribose-phosphate pyrophosphokinase
MICLSIDGYKYPVTSSVFPGGEVHVNVKGNAYPPSPNSITIVAELTSSEEIMKLMLVTDAIRQLRIPSLQTLKLKLAYLPYARQDRVCARGEALSIKVMCDLINSLKFDEVMISDCHSDVGIALLNNCSHTTQLEGFRLNKNIHNILTNSDYLVIPDLGASKKAKEIASKYGLKTIQCTKTRGEDGWISITPLTPASEYEGKRLVVADDICDGGGTFIALAEALRGHRILDLVVTHGIFSKGKLALEKYYDKVVAVYEW